MILGDSSKWQGLVHSRSSVAEHPSPPAPRPNSGGFSLVPNPRIPGSWGGAGPQQLLPWALPEPLWSQGQAFRKDPKTEGD